MAKTKQAADQQPADTGAPVEKTPEQLEAEAKAAAEAQAKAEAEAKAAAEEAERRRLEEEARLAALPKAIKLPSFYSFYDEDGNHRQWAAGIVITDQADIALLVERQVEFQEAE